MNDPIAWCAWNQGFFPSVRKAMVAAAVFLTHPDNPQRSGPNGTTRLFIIRHDTRKGWRLVNCADRAPAPHEMALGFYGPITPRNINAHLNTHKAAMPAGKQST